MVWHVWWKSFKKATKKLFLVYQSVGAVAVIPRLSGGEAYVVVMATFLCYAGILASSLFMGI